MKARLFPFPSDFGLVECPTALHPLLRGRWLVDDFPTCDHFMITMPKPDFITMNIRLCIRNISVQFKAKVLSPDRPIATASLISSIKERYGMMTVVAIRVLGLSDGRPLSIH
jgi:hypothetical protein